MLDQKEMCFEPDSNYIEYYNDTYSALGYICGAEGSTRMSCHDNYAQVYCYLEGTSAYCQEYDGYNEIAAACSVYSGGAFYYDEWIDESYADCQ
jgi:hypothetical protein